MKSILLFPFFCFVLAGYGQKGFSVDLSEVGSGTDFVSDVQVLPLSDGTLLYGQTGTENGSLYYNSMINLDVQGNVIWESHLNHVMGIGGLMEFETQVGMICSDKDAYEPAQFYLKKYNKSGSLEPEEMYTVSLSSDALDPVQTYIQELLPLAHGGWLVIGFSANVTGDYFPILCRLNKDGIPIWAKGFVTTNGYEQAAIETLFHAGVELSDGSFVIAGESLVNAQVGFAGENGFLLKVDSLGNHQWQKLFKEKDVFGRNEVKFYDITLSSNDAVVVVGTKYTEGAGTGSSGVNTALASVQSDGVVNWTKVFGTFQSELQDYGYNTIREEFFSIEPVKTVSEEFTGKYVLSGKMTANDGYYPLFAQINAIGEILNVKRWEQGYMTSTLSHGLWEAERLVRSNNGYWQPFTSLSGQRGIFEVDTTLNSPCQMDSNFTFVEVETLANLDTVLLLGEDFDIEVSQFDSTFIEALNFDARYVDFCDSLGGEQGIGIREHLKGLEFDVWPSPAKTYFWIDLQAKQGEVQLFDIRGQLICEDLVKGKQRWNVETLKSGIYLVKVTTRDEIGVQKIYVE